MTERADEVELNCAVYGEGTVFSLKVVRDEKAEALQKAIFGNQRYKERYSFDASNLTLYMAWKNGAWLKDDDSVDGLLSGEIDPTYKKMRPTWKLNDPELLGPDFQPGEEEIQVLVELPKATDQWKTIVDELGERVDSRVNELGEQVDSRVNKLGERVVSRVNELGEQVDKMMEMLEGQQKRGRECVAISEMSSANAKSC